jgi:FkbM family methyltransferase
MQRPAAQRIMAGRVWEKQTLRFLTSQWRDGDMVHAGTYFGDFLPALSAACPEGSRIWAFEPNPESFRCAQATVAINDCREVELTNAGLGAGESAATMAVCDRRGRGLGGMSRLLEGPGEDSGVVTVQVVAIDDVVPEDRHVSMLQLDVEGHEGPALQGAMGTIERCRPVLVLETVPEGEPVMDKLSGLGYRTRRTVNHNTVLTADD